MPQPNELRLFLSSTFRDLQDEREHLVKKIFPEIRALCRARGITFTEVDLRWGLTDEDQALGRIVRTCLEEVDRCRPYIIGVLGERYGYVPELIDIYKDADLLRTYSWVEEAVMEGASIVDMELRHAALNDPENARDTVRIFTRRRRRTLDEETPTEDARRLHDLKERLRAAGLSIEEFRDPVSLGEMIYDELVEIIRRDFADAAPPTPLEEERSRHRAFAESRRRAYIPNSDYLRELEAWLAGDPAGDAEGPPPLAIYAESGSGKSSLVSFWCESLRRRRPDLFVVEHYVGIGAGDTDHLGIIRHVMEEIRERYERTEEIPEKPADLEREFANWLGFARGAEMLLVIDGINQLEGRALALDWLPPAMPPGVRLLVTSTVEETLVHVRERGWSQLGMQPLREAEREAVIVRFLSEYHKALSTEQIGRIASDPKSSHPLFLRTLLEEIRLHGSHEDLDRRIDYYLRSTGTEDLFQRLLERLEDDYSGRAVREVMSALWASRAGLSEDDLAAVTGLSRLTLSTLLLGLDYHLVRRDGMLSFFHDYLRRAVEKRYLGNAERRRETHRGLARHFASQPAGERTLRELIHQQSAAEEWEELAATLGSFENLRHLSHGDGALEVNVQWARLKQEGYDPGAVLRGTLAHREPDDPAMRTGLRHVVVVLMQMTEWETAMDLLRVMEAYAERTGDAVLTVTALTFQGQVLRGQGRFTEALPLSVRATERAELLGDAAVLADALRLHGSLLNDVGEPREGLAHLERLLAILEERNDTSMMSETLVMMGHIHRELADLERALEFYGRAEAVAVARGNRLGVLKAMGGIAQVHGTRGDTQRALEIRLTQLPIYRQLGLKQEEATCLHNLAIIYQNLRRHDDVVEALHAAQGLAEQVNLQNLLGMIHSLWASHYKEMREYDRAFEHYRISREIAQSIGSTRSEYVVVGNMGLLHHLVGELETALAEVSAALAEHRRMDFPFGMVYWLQGRADLLHDIVCAVRRTGDPLPAYLAAYITPVDETTALTQALADIDEAIVICEKFSKQGMLFDLRLQRGYVRHTLGEIDDGLADLRAMLDEDLPPYSIAAIHFRLWTLADGAEWGGIHHAEGLRIYDELHADDPQRFYAERIEAMRPG